MHTMRRNFVTITTVEDGGTELSEKLGTTKETCRKCGEDVEVHSVKGYLIFKCKYCGLQSRLKGKLIKLGKE